MNTHFNSALKQSTSIKRDLSALTQQQQQEDQGGGSGSGGPSAASLGALSASLTAHARTLDEYAALARQELDPAKQEKAQERIRNFRAGLSESRGRLEGLKAARDDAHHASTRAELLGRRPYATSTPENPYAHQSTSGGGGGIPNRYASSGAAQELQMGSGDGAREAHALREQNFFDSTNSALDDYIARGQAVLGDLGAQRDVLKSTQRRLYSVANTLGVSGDTIRMVERRARQDKWIFWAGVVVFFLFCWLCLHFLR